MDTVLVIDDSSFQRKWLAQAIQQLGYEVVQAENGKEGLELLGDVQPLVITVDLNMPTMDGFDFLGILQKNKISTPTIVITSDIQEDTRNRCLRLGASAILNKPFKPEELKSTIRQVVSKKQEVR